MAQSPLATLAALGPRALSHAQMRLRTRAFGKSLTVARSDDLFAVGDLNYGGYLLPLSRFTESSVCYLAGTGTDISFDLSLIARFGCDVFAFDPVPRAAEYVAQAAKHQPKFHYRRCALWKEDTELTFHAPKIEGYISHSATNMHDTPVAFTSEARSVKSLMAEFGHDHLDLLKISAEGAEHTIVESTIGDGVRPSVICMEFAQPSVQAEVDATMRRLEQAGYTLIGTSVRMAGWKLTFQLAS
jgi:FkbM family methyltransferase